MPTLPQSNDHSLHYFSAPIAKHLLALVGESYNIKASLVLNMISKANLEPLAKPNSPLQPLIIPKTDLWKWNGYFGKRISFLEVLAEMEEHELIRVEEGSSNWVVSLANYGEDLLRGAYGNK